MDREAFIYREALGLYTTGQFSYARALVKRYLISNKGHLTSRMMLLAGYIYEISGDFAKAEKYLNLSWRGLRGYNFVSAVVEDAAVRAYALDNPVGATVLLDIALKRSLPQEEKCYLLFNQYVLKREIGLEASAEEEEFLSDCKDVWFYRYVEQDHSQ